jgi:penicillin-binding protein 1A
MGATEGAMVVLDGSGAVRAMVGGKSYKKSQFNRATKARRQPGSAFKPFLFLAALEQGYRPDSVEVDEPVRIGDWEPENYRKKYLRAGNAREGAGVVPEHDCREAGDAGGAGEHGAVAHRLGITSKLGNDASLALGTSEVTLLEMTSAFVPFSNGGYPVVPYSVKRILTRDGTSSTRETAAAFPRL